MAVNGKAKDLTGDTFGYWSVLEKSESSSYGHRMYLCRCVCGKEKLLRGTMLTSGKSVSCRCVTFVDKNKKHGMSNTRTYRTWISMRQRCSEPKYAHYEKYGGSGIRVCDRWNNSFEFFLEDMGVRPQGMTIDRIDNSKGYFKENCRWATNKEQTLNRGVTNWLTAFGETLCMNDMARKYGMTTTMLRSRLKRGMSIEAALTKRHEKCEYVIRFNGLSFGFLEFCKKYSISSSTVYRKINNGETMLDGIIYCMKLRGIKVDSSDISIDHKFNNSRAIIEGIVE